MFVSVHMRIFGYICIYIYTMNEIKKMFYIKQTHTHVCVNIASPIVSFTTISHPEESVEKKIIVMNQLKF